MIFFRTNRIAAACLAACCLFHGIAASGETGAKPNITILSTTFPIYQITRNIVAGADGIETELLLPGMAGCPHDYALTPGDMTKIARADVLVINGLGMENFLGAPLARVNPDLAVIDSAEGMGNLLGYSTTENVHPQSRSHNYDDHQDREHDHDHDDVNPHLFASPVLSAALAQNIASQLGELDPVRAEIYRRNAAAYGQTMERLTADMRRVVPELSNKRIVDPHGVFDYLARDIGLQAVAIPHHHDAEPSPTRLLELVTATREAGAGAIVVEPQYPTRSAETLARETGLPAIVLDSGASGLEDAPLEHYETIMRRNMDALIAALAERRP